MQTYISRVSVAGEEYQNPQELVTIWGDIRADVERLDGEISETYAVFGEYDFHIVLRVPDRDSAFEVTQIIERHGLDTATMQAIPLEHLGEIVDDT